MLNMNKVNSGEVIKVAQKKELYTHLAKGVYYR